MDKKETSILLLGIVAILAIIGLVILFTRPAITGKISSAQEMGGGLILIPLEYPCDSAPPCINGKTPVDMNQNIYNPATKTYNRVCWCMGPQAIFEMPVQI